MTMLLVLLAPHAEASLHPETICNLTRLGITRLALVRDAHSLGVLVEGWRFDPVGSARSVVEVIAGDSAGVRVLAPIAEMNLVLGD